MVTEVEIKNALELRHTKALQDKISAAHVAVCGLGGLGSHVALALARCGLGHLHLIDFDRVDITNLNRQQYAIEDLGRPKPEALRDEIFRFMPYIDIRTDFVRLTEENIPGILRDDDIICEAFDKPEQKAMLTNAVLSQFPEKYLVGASGMAGWGKSNEITTKEILPHYFLCGDGVSDVEKVGTLTDPRVMLCAAHQANKIIEIIIEK